MTINIQPLLQTENIILSPLAPADFDELYAVAGDPEIWEQHPNKDRWKKEVFKTFFDGALQSHGAFKIVDKHSGETMGCTRFYDHNAMDKSIHIGYTFYAKKYWGKGINHSVKTIMLNYIFQFVSVVCFHVGAVNIRSQIAITRLGATKFKELEIAYFGELPKLNFVYKLTKEAWLVRNSNAYMQP